MSEGRVDYPCRGRTNKKNNSVYYWIISQLSVIN